MRRTLVVVDMQPRFVNSEAEYINRTIELIRWFMIGGNPIIFVESAFGEGKIIKAVKDTVKGYGNHVTVNKRSNDGSWQVWDACLEHGFPIDFVVCGVYYDCCVMETSYALAKRFSVEVVMDCTDSPARIPSCVDYGQAKTKRWFAKDAA